MKEAVCFSFLSLFVPQLNLHKIDSEDGWKSLLWAQTTWAQRDLRKLHLHQNCVLLSFSSTDYRFLGFFFSISIALYFHVHVSLCMCGTYLGGCTGRRTPSWHCMGVNWSGRADRVTRTRFRGRSGGSVAAIPPHPPVPPSRSPSAACLGCQHRSSPATHLAPYGGKRHVRHRLTQHLFDI